MFHYSLVPFSGGGGVKLPGIGCPLRDSRRELVACF